MARASPPHGHRIPQHLCPRRRAAAQGHRWAPSSRRGPRGCPCPSLSGWGGRGGTDAAPGPGTGTARGAEGTAPPWGSARCHHGASRCCEPSHDRRRGAEPALSRHPHRSAGEGGSQEGPSRRLCQPRPCGQALGLPAASTHLWRRPPVPCRAPAALPALVLRRCQPPPRGRAGSPAGGEEDKTSTYPALPPPLPLLRLLRTPVAARGVSWRLPWLGAGERPRRQLCRRLAGSLTLTRSRFAGRKAGWKRFSHPSPGPS